MLNTSLEFTSPASWSFFATSPRLSPSSTVISVSTYALFSEHTSLTSSQPIPASRQDTSRQHARYTSVRLFVRFRRRLLPLPLLRCCSDAVWRRTSSASHLAVAYSLRSSRFPIVMLLSARQPIRSATRAITSLCMSSMVRGVSPRAQSIRVQPQRSTT